MISQNSSFYREDYLKKKRKKKLVRYGIFLAIIILIIGISSYVSSRPEVLISKVVLNGEVLVEEKEVESKSLEYMANSYFWLFPKRNALWYPKGDLEEYLKETFQRIDTIDISLDDSNTLVVDIIEREPQAIWCDDTNESSQKCYFMDKNATIFAEAPQFSGDAYFKYYGLVSSSSPIGGYYIASSTKFYEITDFIKKAEALSLKPIYMTIEESGEFILNLNSGGKILFDTKESLSKVGQNLEALLHTPALSKNISNLDYIDLRYGNKLYYKLK